MATNTDPNSSLNPSEHLKHMNEVKNGFNCFNANDDDKVSERGLKKGLQN